jgi:hypothetical protein
LIKNNIATADAMDNTAGSYALAGAKVPRDSTIVAKLRKAGAIILGKTNLSQWANYRQVLPVLVSKEHPNANLVLDHTTQVTGGQQLQARQSVPTFRDKIPPAAVLVVASHLRWGWHLLLWARRQTAAF